MAASGAACAVHLAPKRGPRKGGGVSQLVGGSGASRAWALPEQPQAAAFDPVATASAVITRERSIALLWLSPSPPLSSPAKAGDPVRRGLSWSLWRLWNTGSPGEPGDDGCGWGSSVDLIVLAGPPLRCSCRHLDRCHHPRKRLIQYAVVSRGASGVSGILDRPVEPGDDSCGWGGNAQPSEIIARGGHGSCDFVLAPRVRVRALLLLAPRSREAQGRPGAGCTHGPPAEKMQAAETTGSAEHSGLPCAMDLRLLRGLPGARACGHRCPRDALASAPAWHQHRDARTPRLGRAP